MIPVEKKKKEMYANLEVEVLDDAYEKHGSGLVVEDGEPAYIVVEGAEDES